MPNEQGNEQRVLVVAPVGRDASLICDLLTRQGFGCESCGNVRELAGKIGEGTGALVITDEALRGNVLGQLLEALNRQPPWSDVFASPSISASSSKGSWSSASAPDTSDQ